MNIARIRRLRKTTRQYIMVALICTFVIGATSILLCGNYYFRMKKEYSNSYETVKKELEGYSKEIYVAAADIAQGETLTQDKLILNKVVSSNKIEDYITVEDIGSITLVPLIEDTHVLKSMVTEGGIDTDVRELFFEGIKVSPNIMMNDTVDIRISYPNGEDYIVLSKKYIPLIQEDNTKLYMHLEEEEILRMSSALVDAYLYVGTYIYTSKYIEASVQEESIVTYIPSMEIMELIKNSPNILRIAMSSLSSANRRTLEERLDRSKDINNSVPSSGDNSGYQQRVSTNANGNYVDSDGFSYYTEEDYQLGE